MADNKKSFILYCDLIHTVEHLTDEQAGHLFKHILEYVNDLNPQTDNVITKLSFEPIKQQLKRDLKKWEEKTGQRSEAGLNSALSKFRTKLDLSTKLEIENIKKDIESRLSNDKENEYLQQALIICNERLTKSTTVESRSTKSTVNVTVNDTVTVNDNDNVNKYNNIKSEIEVKDLPTKVGLPKINDKSLYTLCVEAWFENWSDYVFSKVDGSKMKNIIKQLKTFAKRNNIEPTDEEILNYWKIIINKMPKFYQGKDLKTVDSKLNEIVNEIKTNKNERNKQSKYAN